MTKSTLRFFTFLSLFFATVFNLQAQVGSSKWAFSNPKPFGFVSYQISYADNNNALIVGEAGGIAKTSNGGGNWSYFAYTTTNAAGELSRPVFNDVQYVNSTLAYAVGNDGIMIKSVDGGINWTLVTTPYFANQLEINSVFFTDANTGYIGGDGDPVTRTATIYKTIDGGASWQAAFTFPAPVEEWQSATIYKIRFTTSGVGYVGGSAGMVYKFQNNNWTDYSITPMTVYPNVGNSDTVLYDNGMGGFDTVLVGYADNIANLDQQNYRAIAIINDTAIVVGTQNNGGLIRINTSTPAGIYHMINNGTTPVLANSPLGSPQIYNLISKDGNTVAGTSSYGKMLLSTDKGFTWQQQDIYAAGSSEEGIAFYGIDISSGNRFGLCGQAGIIADSATQWRKPFTYTKKSLGFGGYGIESISFANATHGIAAGAGGAMLRTANSGDTWEDISNNSFTPWDYYTSVAYLKPDVLLAAASNGMFYKSFDSGTSFDLMFAEPSNANLTAMHFNNEDTGWMVANITYTDEETFENSFHQVIYRTVDGGSTWDSSNTVFPTVSDFSLYNYLYDIKFLGNTGFAAGANGSIFKSIDGGITWIKQNNIPAFAADKIIRSIAFGDANIIYASGDQGLVMKTINGGATWTLTNTGLPSLYTNFGKVLMYDAAMGMVFTRGAVYTTIDGGGTWAPYYVPVNDGLNAAAFAPLDGCTTGICKKVFAAGSFRGNILKFDADIVLPVKFSKLTGSGTTQGNQLFWTAFAQETVNYYEVERSSDGVRFQKVADKVYPGAMSYQSYQWLDVNVADGRNFYRIKATEKSGAVYYTNTVLISNKKAGQWSYQVSNGNLVINNTKVQKGNVSVTVMNAAGQKAAVQNWNQAGGAFNQSIQLPPTVKGLYFVQVDNEGVTYSFKILIQ